MYNFNYEYMTFLYVVHVYMFCNVVLYCFTCKGFICNKDYYYYYIFYYFHHRLQSMNSSLQGRPESALGARGVQITEFNESKINPEPVVLEDSEILMEQYLSPGKLVGF